MANLISKKGPAAGFSIFDPSSSSDETAPPFDSNGDDDDDDDDDCISLYSIGAADADDESEAVVRYAEKATFRRPIMVHCQAGSRKVAMQEVLEAGPPQEQDLLVEPGQEGIPITEGEANGDGDGEMESEEFDAEAEERLERRLAEDRAREQVNQGSAVIAEEEAEELWSDVVYDESILDEHLKRRREEKEEEGEREKRLGSAMSELDALVKDSLFIAHDDEGPTRRPLAEADGGRKRKVSFTKPADVDVAPGHKKVPGIGPATPYPFGDGKEETYGFKVNMEVAPEQWEMNEFGGRGSLAEGDKARKVLGLVDADEMINSD